MIAADGHQPGGGGVETECDHRGAVIDEARWVDNHRGVAHRPRPHDGRRRRRRPGARRA
ncbi:MAG: hypothetical protein HS111_32610 [Kofleriaceae bacterium]|nr:hypothetical protein [Kofleriaceae bacterium]